VDSVDKSNILIGAYNHEGLSHFIEFYGFVENAPEGTTNQKAASSSLAGRTIKINNLQKSQKFKK
jgi:hypothetical protein